MRKNIFLIICFALFVHTVLAAQTRQDILLTNFENQSVFFTSTAINLSMQVVANPDKSGENTSDYVLKIDAAANNADWEAVYTPNNTTGLKLNIDAANGYRYLHFKVHKSFTSGMLWGLYKQEGGSLTAKYPEQQRNFKTNEWEYIVVDLLRLTDTWNVTAGTYYRLNFAPDKTSNPRIAYTMYLDDVYLSDSSEKILQDNEWDLVFEENFDGTSVNQSNWYIYDFGGHAGNGLRSPRAFTVEDGLLVVTAQMIDGSLVSGGMAHRKNYTYGKFEFRVKATADPSGATSAVVLTWPQSEKWPDDGENDIYETHSSSNPNRTFFESNILSGAPLNKWSKGRYDIDAKEWNIVAMEWEADAIRIFVNGVKTWELTDPDAIVDKPHHLCIQLDAFKTTMTGVSRMYVDWVKIYQKKEVAANTKPVQQQRSIGISLNPVKDFLRMDWADNQSSGIVDIFAVDGRFVKSIRANNSEIDCSKLKSGLYFLRINTGTTAETIKFIKQ